MTTEPAADVAENDQRVIEIDTLAQLIAFIPDDLWPLVRDEAKFEDVRKAARRIYEHGFRLAQPAIDLDALRAEVGILLAQVIPDVGFFPNPIYLELSTRINAVFDEWGKR